MQIRMKSVLLWGACLALVGLGLLAAVHSANPPVVIAVPDTALPRSVDAADAPRTTGDANAPVQIVVYSDFQCPSCGYFAANLHGLPADASGRVRVVYRYFPLPQHSNAIVAATAAEAAAMQGKFWEMHDLLFAKQKEWSPMAAADAQVAMRRYAEELRLNLAAFEKDMNSPEVLKRIQASQIEAMTGRLRQTPSVFINGRLVENISQPGVLKGAIYAAGPR